jgi:hypothetical protein
MRVLTERDILESKKIYASIFRKEGTVRCVWTRNVLASYDIDHGVPFSVCVWKNNDLWNLIPAKACINNLKRDKSPSAKLIEDRKEEIVRYWNLLQETQGKDFKRKSRLRYLASLLFLPGRSRQLCGLSAHAII